MTLAYFFYRLRRWARAFKQRWWPDPPQEPRPMDPEFERLIKALEAGTCDPALAQGFPLIVEDLAPVMAVVTYSSGGPPPTRWQKIKWWIRWHWPVYNVVETWNDYDE